MSCTNPNCECKPGTFANMNPPTKATNVIGEHLSSTRRVEYVTTNTPWGKADSVTRYGLGINFYTTPGHGGFKLSEKMNRLVPIELRRQSFGGLGLKGWYEEDCDAYIVMAVFSQHFTADEVERARKALASYLPVSKTVL